MYTIKTSELLAGKKLPHALTDVATVKAIADVTGGSKPFELYAARSGDYTIEFCFEKGICQYVMIEEDGAWIATPRNEVAFDDDVLLFAMTREAIRHRYVVEENSEEKMVIGGVALYMDEENVDSIYYFPDKSKNIVS